VACLVLVPVLGYLGLHVIRREVVFIDMAVAQFAAVGAIAAHMTLHVSGDSATAMLAAWGVTVAAGVFYAVVRRYASWFPLEAVIGISYASAAAGALLMIGKGSSGHTHIQQMLTGSLLWVTWSDIGWSSLWFAVAGLLFVVLRQPFQRITDGYDAAVSTGMQVVLWDILFYALCGLVSTVAVRTAGLVVVFCFLIIPATAATVVADGWGRRLAFAAVFGITASAAGLFFCQLADFSAGVSVALWLGIFLVLTLLPQYLRRPARESLP
jgi:zinc/manganese transport system permease protein